MAKVGNEVKLILRLAAEEMQRQVELMQRRHTAPDASSDWVEGYTKAHSAWQLTLDNIILDLERK